ncbi:MAG: EAL domain-containing response regulator [Myxococcota bacterium]
MTRILAVDDDPHLAFAIEEILAAQGFEVACAHDASTAIAMARREKFDVAVVDYNMPGQNGLEVLRVLRDRHPSCMRILASGHLELPVVVDAVNRGEVAHVLHKPFMHDQLLTAVAQALESRARYAKVNEANDRTEDWDRDMVLQCLSDGLVKLALQPIVGARCRELAAYEALMRISHPVLNNPLKILAAAERCGLIHEVGEVVAERASEWLVRMPSHLLLFMNLHPSELSNPDRLVQRLQPLAWAAERVVLEITERSKLLDFESWDESAERLTSMGFKLAVDDLGAGYNSLSTLVALRPAFIKIDMSIVRDADCDERKRRLIELLCKFAEATESQVVAEGVETDNEAKAVIDAGVDLVQGYLFGKPRLDWPMPRGAAVA